MKQLLVTCLLLAASIWMANGQERWSTRSGEVRMNASTPLEDIDALNSRVNAILEPGSGGFAVVMLISEFRFPRKLMEEHFNENYMESGRFPKATFSGKIHGLSGIGPGEEQTCRVSGELTIHGVTRPLETEAVVSRGDGAWTIRSRFTVHTEDHGIEIPRIVFKKIAEDVRVTADFLLEAETGR